MKRCIVKVSTHLILDALAFPEGSEIEACLGERAPLGEIELIISHDDLPDVPEGNPLPSLLPTFTLVGDLPAKFIEFDWNLENKGYG